MVLLSTAGLDEEHFGLIDETRAEGSVKQVEDIRSLDELSVCSLNPVRVAMAEDAAHEAVAFVLLFAVFLEDVLHLFCGLVPVHLHREAQPFKHPYERL